MTSAFTEKVTEVVERAGRDSKIEAVDVQWLGAGRSRLLRIFIDKPGGVTHADCEMISQYVGTVLDAEDLVPGDGYTLEVSSPGVERPLAKPRDFERSVGRKIKVVLRDPVDGRASWDATLAAFDGAVLTLAPEGREPIAVPLASVKRANLKFEW